MRKFTKVALVASAIGGAACLVKKVAQNEDVKEKFGKARQAGTELLKSITDQLTEKNAGDDAETEEAEEAEENGYPVVTSEDINVMKKVLKDADEMIAKKTSFENFTKEDIEKYVRSVIGCSNTADPFWDDTARTLLCACVGLLVDYCGKKTEDAAGYLTPKAKAAVLEEAKDLKADRTSLNLLFSMDYPKIDAIMSRIEERYEDAGLDERPYCVKRWKSFKLAPARTRAAVVKDVAIRLGIPVPATIPVVNQVDGTSMMQALAGNLEKDQSKDDCPVPKAPTMSANSVMQALSGMKPDIDKEEKSEAETDSKTTGVDMMATIKEINKSNPDVDDEDDDMI